MCYSINRSLCVPLRQVVKNVADFTLQTSSAEMPDKSTVCVVSEIQIKDNYTFKMSYPFRWDSKSITKENEYSRKIYEFSWCCYTQNTITTNK